MIDEKRNTHIPILYNILPFFIPIVTYIESASFLFPFSGYAQKKVIIVDHLKTVSHQGKIVDQSV